MSDPRKDALQALTDCAQEEERPECRCYHYGPCSRGEVVEGLDDVRCKTCPYPSLNQVRRLTCTQKANKCTQKENDSIPSRNGD